MSKDAEQVIKKRRNEYIRDTFILLSVLVIVATGIALAIKFLKTEPPTIAIYDEDGEDLGYYAEDGDVTVPTKTGYSTSWLAESGKSYESIQAALDSGETSIKQVFTVIEYTVTLYLIGGEMADDLGFEHHDAIEGQEAYGDYYTRVYTVEDENFDLPTIKPQVLVTKRGCKFECWSNVNYIGKNYPIANLKESTKVETIETEHAQNVVLYAAWSDIMCNINMHGLNGKFLFVEPHKETSLLDEEDLTAKIAEYTPEGGYIFTGFYADSSLTIN